MVTALLRGPALTTPRPLLLCAAGGARSWRRRGRQVCGPRIAHGVHRRVPWVRSATAAACRGLLTGGCGVLQNEQASGAPQAAGRGAGEGPARPCLRLLPRRHAPRCPHPASARQSAEGGGPSHRGGGRHRRVGGGGGGACRKGVDCRRILAGPPPEPAQQHAQQAAGGRCERSRVLGQRGARPRPAASRRCHQLRRARASQDLPPSRGPHCPCRQGGHVLHAPAVGPGAVLAPPPPLSPRAEAPPDAHGARLPPQMGFFKRMLRKADHNTVRRYKTKRMPWHLLAPRVRAALRELRNVLATETRSAMALYAPVEPLPVRQSPRGGRWVPPTPAHACACRRTPAGSMCRKRSRARAWTIGSSSRKRAEGPCLRTP